jgi:hypothetical protein
MAVRRPDWRIRILGRVDDVLNARKKYPVAPIEQKIQQLLGVDEVCVFSGLNAAGNEELAVAIQSGRQLSRSEVEVVARRCAPFFNEFHAQRQKPARRGGLCSNF